MRKVKSILIPQAKPAKQSFKSQISKSKKTAYISHHELAARVAEIHALREKVRKAIQRLQ